ncbi:ArsR/SmtB family transcription factor [Nocardioides panacisoli]|uniref:HTH arsR-type domain-containing protein n=1 Tax=Nocardioides panacisoli TaxID=627624 RepID=A0ABP7I2I1_9ACTN
MTDEETASLRATAHPLRLRMLSLLTGTAMSAAEVARELGITHANASYHLRVLLDAGLIDVEGEERIRGGMAKRYQHHFERSEPRRTSEQLTDEVAAMTQELLRRWRANAGRMQTLTDAELWVTPAVWQEVLEALRRTSLALHEQAQRPRTEGTVKVNLTIAGFLMESDS